MMQAFILTGGIDEKNNYLEEFYSKHHVEIWNKHHFPEFKILDARNVSLLVSKKLPIGTVRTIVIENPTIEAQHALLKTIEELHEGTFIFFLVTDPHDVLETILSRCKVIHFESKTISEDQDLRTEVQKLLENNFSNIFSFIEKYGQEKKHVDEIILAIREVMLEKIKKGENVQGIFTLLQHLLSVSPFIKNNNVNTRIALENVFFTSL